MRKICIVVNSRANYARIKSVLKAVEEHPNLELLLVVGASALLYRFGNIVDIIKQDGFQPSAKLHLVIEGDTPSNMAKSTGLGIIELTSIFENLKPDIVLTVADRYETMATAIAASYMNIPLAHTQGGELTGSIDESVRHAITKLAHIHFPATKDAEKNILQMGEDSKKVFVTGCPAMDIISEIDTHLSDDFFEINGGVGFQINPKEKYIVILQHPVTTEYEDVKFQIDETLGAIQNLDMQIVWLWPNVDAGTDQISQKLRSYRENNKGNKIRFFKNFSAENYAKLIKNCCCLVGNSSSAIREGSFLGVPAVNIGSRQNGREHGENVMNVNYNCLEIKNAVIKQMSKSFPPNQIFGDGKAGLKIANILAEVDLDISKKFLIK